MNERLQRETKGLIKSWMRHDERMLRDYLVADVEDPRINIQSILTRHFLIESLFGDRFAALMDHELRFGVVLNWLLRLGKRSDVFDESAAILHALERGADNAEGLSIPVFLSQTFASLPATLGELSIPQYLAETLLETPSVKDGPRIDSRRLSTFERIWRKVLESEAPCEVTVLEPACGSATDYRFLDAFGMARLVNYTGFDLCDKNIRNARAMFPETRFQSGNVFELQATDKAFDVCVVHDLFEHLSIEAMERAVAEVCRVTRHGLCVGFFSMHEGADHLVRPVEDYHWNTLSMARTGELFEHHGFSVQPVHIGTFLKWRFGCDETYNENAYTFLATPDESGIPRSGSS